MQLSISKFSQSTTRASPVYDRVLVRAEVFPALASTGHHVKMRHILGSRKLQDDRKDEPQSWLWPREECEKPSPPLVVDSLEELQPRASEMDID
jgi:hypothetical protein